MNKLTPTEKFIAGVIVAIVIIGPLLALSTAAGGKNAKQHCVESLAGLEGSEDIVIWSASFDWEDGEAECQTNKGEWEVNLFTGEGEWD
jgi:hypothetical protein